MKSTLHRIEEIKKTGYRLDLGEAINEIFENYKKIALLAGAVLLLVGIAALIIVGGITALILGVSAVTETFTEYSEGAMSSTGFMANLIVSIIGAGLFAPITAGLIQMAHNAAINKDFDFGTAFIHYKSEYFKELFFAAAIITLVGSGLNTLFQITNINYPGSDLLVLGTAVSGFLSIIIQLFTLLTIPLIIFGNLKAMDAIKGSFVLVAKNFWIILLLAIIAFFFLMIGLVAICIGIIFTVPILYSLQYILYKTALPIAESNELDEIGQSV
jgi:uncharacterized membrane protein